MFRVVYLLFIFGFIIPKTIILIIKFLSFHLKTFIISCLFLTITFTSFTQQVKIGEQIWQKKNLDVSTFRNGDIIPEAKTTEEWLEANENKQAAWCYFDNDKSLSKESGKLYNWYAVNDPRGLAPKGWKVPTFEDYMEIVNFYNVEASPEQKEKQLEKAWEYFEQLKSDFERTKQDSLFAKHHSDNFKNYSPTFEILRLPTNSFYSFSNEEIEKIENQEVGTVLIFQKKDDKIKLVKRVGEKEVDFVTMRHMLLKNEKYPGGKTGLEFADSLLEVIKNQNNFIELLTLFSEDKGSVENEGVYSNVLKFEMVEPLDSFIFNNPVGSIAVMLSPYGPSIVEILNKKTAVRPVVVEVTKKIVTEIEIAHQLKDKNNYKDFPIYLDTENKFKAVLTGLRTVEGEFVYNKIMTLIWTQSLGEENYPIAIFMSKNDHDVKYSSYQQEFGLSVRCIKE